MADYSQAELTALRAAYAKGVQTVEYEGHRVTYPSGSELLARIREIERNIAAGTATARPTHRMAGFRRD